MAVSILAPNHGLEVVVPQGRLKEVNGLVLVNSLGHHKCLLDKLLVFPLPVGKSALKTLRQIYLKNFYNLWSTRCLSVLYWPLNHISKTEFQPFFLFNEYCLLGLHLQESFHIKVDAKEVSQITRIHVLDVDSQIATIIADNHFSLHDAAYLDTKHIAVMVKQQLISEKFVFFSREVA